MNVRSKPEPALVGREQLRLHALRTPQEAERIAWIVLGAGFVVFCFLAVLAVAAFRTYYVYGTVPMPATLVVQRGVVLLQANPTTPDTPASNGMFIQEGDTLKTTEAASAALDLPEGSKVELLPNTVLEVRELQDGRFRSGLKRVSFRQLSGISHVTVAQDESDPHDIRVATPHGEVTFSAGEFTIWVRSDSTRVSAAAGRASAWAHDERIAFEAGQKIVLQPAMPPSGPLPAAEDLIHNGDFARGLEGWGLWSEQESSRPDVRGSRSIVETEIDGRKWQALRVTRETELDTHNETGIEQVIDKDVTAYRKLTLQARVRLRYASLSGGGYAGSEYPLMLRVIYVAEGNNVPIKWFHGFYYRNPEDRPTDQGTQIPREHWFQYAGDLATLDPPPARILAVQVLGAGHDFDAMATDIRLIGE